MHSDPAYHLRELAVAQTIDDPRRILPEIPPGCQRVLDVGCGAGQSLVACAAQHKDPGCQWFGIDFEQAAVRLGPEMGVPAALACASGEALPFREGSFDFVFSRVALPYMDIPVAVAEMKRVLRAGGGLWLTLHPLGMLSWGKALSSPRRTVFEAYRLANTVALHFLGTQFRYPLRRQRIESYQTVEGMRRLLRTQGFENIDTRLGRHFVVTASKRS